MRRLTLILSLLLGFALLTAACGSDDDDSTEVGSTDDAADPDASADDANDGGTVDPEPDTDTDTELPLGGGPYPIADLTFVVDVTETEEEPATYRLACLGDTATFTGDAGGLDAASACLALNDDEVRDRLTTDQHLDRICTEIYGGPEVANVTGTLDDQPVDTQVGRNDGCGIDDWDRLLAALLLPPAGA